MSVEERGTVLTGLWNIAFAGRPVVWPFLRDMRVDIRTNGRPEQRLVRVLTPGGAELRAYAGLCATDGRLLVAGVESNTGRLELTLVTHPETDGRHGLSGTYRPSDDLQADGPLESGVWYAERLTPAPADDAPPTPEPSMAPRRVLESAALALRRSK